MYIEPTHPVENLVYFGEDCDPNLKAFVFDYLCDVYDRRKAEYYTHEACAEFVQEACEGLIRDGYT